MKKSIKSGAGFVLYRKIDSKIKFLALIGPRKFRVRSCGVYDIPKGSIDNMETYLECAIRECFEETSILINKEDVFLKNRNFLGLRVFLAECRIQDPKIIPNKHTGILEHEGFRWMDPDLLYDNCYNYLKPCILWAKKEILNNYK